MSRHLISVNRVDAGLGNRVRAVLGAQSLAQVEGRRFWYVWPTGRDFGPRLTDLWQFQAPVLPQTVARGMRPVWPYRDHTLQWLTPGSRRELVWQIRTAHALHLPAAARPWEDSFRDLRPAAAVADRVQQFHRQHLRGRRYVGVMIRAHARSHQTTLQTSPVDWFVERMGQLRATSPDLAFFVSCDVPEVTEAVLRAIPGSVSQADKGPYNSVPGVQAAVADLYLLASSAYLLGPHWSSFVELAHILAGGQVGLESSVEHRGPATPAKGLPLDPLTPWER